MIMALPSVIEGYVHADVRGTLRFCNGFDLSAVKRFYTIANSAGQSVRGWIGHKKETKWFFPLKGTTVIVVEPMDDSRARSTRFILAAESPAVLNVPCNHWFYIEQHEGAEVMVFSDCKVGEYKNDDFRRQL